MKIRTLLYSLVGAVALVACDEVAEEDRLVYVEPADVHRAVLIEDFTGQLCLNCPNAAEEIERLMADYGEETIIAVGIHCGNLSMNTTPTGFQGFRTATGDYYMKKWSVSTQPSGLVNRVGGLKSYSEWATAVASEASKAPGAVLEGAFTQESDSSSMLSIRLDALKNLKGTLQVWLVEDDIVSIQQMPDNKLNTAYCHKHVFRAAANGQDGETIALQVGESDQRSYTLALDPVWNVEKLSAVVFVADAEGVQQVIRLALRSSSL